MKKAVLISIHPKWCELIASGKKTIEVRKTATKIETPFKCYIYCTKPSFPHEDFFFTDDGGREIRGFYGGGKVIGEFVCDKFTNIAVPFPAYWPEFDKSLLDGTCLSLTDVHKYLGHRSGYGWHISDLVIYDEPSPLTNYHRPCQESLYCESCAMLSEQRGCGNAALQITRPPQSWCYVEDMV